ncbi:MAG: ATP-grasp fold amidoligase family protein [Chlorobiaceae bacterium]
MFAKYRYKLCTGKSLDYKIPKTYNDKFFWLNLYWRHPLKTQCADKYSMREYVQQKSLGHILPILFGTYENSSEIDFDFLPEKFVLKCTHGCGFNIICENKAFLDKNKAKSQLDQWLEIDFGKVYGELHYSGIKPRIICEEYLDNLDGESLCDYKVFCFNGKVHCTLVCQDRHALDQITKFDYYDREWKTKLPYIKSSLLADRNVSKPDAYDKIINAAEMLSQPFPFVRMDFYCIKGKAILGEMTFTPSACVSQDLTEIAQHQLGELIMLPSSSHFF